MLTALPQQQFSPSVRPGARASHHLATAARDTPQSAPFSPIGLLDVQSSTPPRPAGRKHHISRHLAGLATRRGEKYGLGNGGENCLYNETPRGRDFVAAGVPAQTFSVGNAAVRSV